MSFEHYSMHTDITKSILNVSCTCCTIHLLRGVLEKRRSTCLMKCLTYALEGMTNKRYTDISRFLHYTLRIYHIQLLHTTPLLTFTHQVYPGTIDIEHQPTD